MAISVHGRHLNRTKRMPKDAGPHRVWTIVDCEGQLYVSPGYRFVNRIDYALCEVPWTDEDRLQPDYRYDWRSHIQ